MDFSSAALLKAFGGLAVASTAVTVGVVKRDSITSALGLGKQTNVAIPANDPKTEADKKLIEYINNENQDIVFDVLKGEDETNNFEITDLNFQTNSSPKTIVIRVKVGTAGDDNFKVKNSQTRSPAIEELKKLNTDGTDWTWECKIKLTTTENIGENKELSGKEKLLKSSGDNGGLFDILKEDSTTKTGEGSEQKIKKIKATKIKFMENCASAEGNTTTPRTFSANKLFAIQEFQIKIGATGAAWGTETNKLFFEDKAKFSKWFGEVTVSQ